MKHIETDSDAQDQLKNNPGYYKSSNSLIEQLKNSPIPNAELLRNLFIYQDRRALSRFLFLNELYQKNIQLHGSIFEFGVRYGVNTCLFSSLRGIYEPYNHNRKIVAFDTFCGFPTVDADTDSVHAEEGQFGVPNSYEDHLEEVLNIHEKLAPVEGIKKFQLVKGNVETTLPLYLKEHPETMISFAYLDFDIFEPTFSALNNIEPYLVNGAIVAFDEINVADWPGETVALRRWIGERNMHVFQSQFKAAGGYVIFER